MAEGKKKTSVNKTKSGGKQTGTKKTSASSSKKSSTAKRKETLAKQQKKREIKRDLFLLAAMAVTILLFLALFDRVGAIGAGLASFEYGIFGSLAYVFPFFILIAAMYLIYKGEAYPLHAWGKVLLVFVMLTLLAGMFELVGNPKSVLPTLKAYYEQGKLPRASGGLFGGFWCRLFVPGLGRVGAWIVSLALLLGSLMLLIGKGVFTLVGQKGSKVVDSIKEENTRYKSAAEERRLAAQLRLEEKERARAEERAARAKAEADEKKAVLAKIAAQQEERRKAEEAAAKARPVRFDEIQLRKDGEQPLSRKQQESLLKMQAEERARAQSKADADRKYGTAGKTGWEQTTLDEAGILEKGSPLSRLMNEMDESRGVKRDTRTIREIGRLDDAADVPASGRELYSDDIVMAGRGNMMSSEYVPTGRITQGYGTHRAPAAEDSAADEKEPLKESSVEKPIPVEGKTGPRIRMNQPSADQAFGDGVTEAAPPVKPIIRDTAPTVSTNSSENVEEEVFEDPRLIAERLKQAGKDTVATKTDSIWNTGKERSGSGSTSFAATEKMPQNAGKTASPQQKGTPAAVRRTEAPAQDTDPVKAAPHKEYKLPPVSLLARGKSGTGMKESDLRRTAKVLEDTLAEFGVAATVTDVSCGPSVTRYELKPEQGVRVNRIAALSDDIKLALAATEIRIEAPIPGKSAVGIEVPNSENQTVYLRTLIESEALAKMHSKIAFAVGQDIGGEMVVADLAKMPHLLIAGATGSGKSVCINSLILSLLYRTKPDEVQMIMIDPKVVELSVYNGIPHLRIPVVTDAKLAADALNGAVKEMTRRYKLFADLNVRDIKGYNAKVKDNPEEYGDREILPQIVIIVDEFADLMMVSKQDVEQSVCRLAQLARAAGLHLVLATQRPSVDVITGLIKANIQSRIALAVSSGVDSRTIIDMNGAEKLLGKGDMLFYPTGYPKPVRVQGCWVSDEEVAAVRDFWAKQCNVTEDDMAKQNRSWMNDPVEREHPVEDERDELFVKAAEYIIDNEKASIGNLQRIFRIGFNRAARLMDQLADAGIVGKDNGTKSRDILMDQVQFADWKHENGYE